jgi:hypothetical protein
LGSISSLSAVSKATLSLLTVEMNRFEKTMAKKMTRVIEIMAEVSVLNSF